MKKKFTKIWGIGLVIVLLSTLFVAGGTGTVLAADLAWSTQAIPGGPTGTPGATNQVSGGTDAALVQVAPNGDIFAVDTAAGNTVYKSVDGGVTWGTKPTTVCPAGDVIADLKVSPSYGTDKTVMALVNNAAGNAVVYVSSDASVTYTALTTQVAAGEVGTSLAIAPTYNGGGQIMVGTYNAAAGFGDVYVWGQPGFTYVWNPQALNEDVTAVAFSPAYALDYTIIAVGSTAANTFVHTKVSTSAWDGTVGTGAAVTIATTTGIITEVDGVAATEIKSAALAFPSDFRASVWPTSAVFYLAVRSEQTDDRIFRVLAGGGATGSVAMDPNAAPGFPAAGDDEATSLAYSGTGLTGTLFVGYAGVAGALNAQVYSSTTAGTTLPSWTPATVPPTGTIAAVGQLTYVAVPPDYATSNKVYAGTLGTNSAVSVSVDKGVTFYQAGLIDTAIAAIDDFQAASPTEFFLVTNDGGAGVESIWKSIDAGATWRRYGSAVTTTAGIVRLSPTYDTDATVVFGNVGSGAASNIMISNDGGVHWVPANCPIVVNDIAVKDIYTYYIGGPASVDCTLNGGWTWQQPGPTAVTGGVNDIEIDPATGHILVGTLAGTAWLSTDSNLTYVPVGALGVAAGAAVVAFDTNYETNSTIYGADTTAVGVYRIVYAPGALWAVIDGASPFNLVQNAAPTDILCAPDGTLYVSDDTAAAATPAGGITRSINPTAPFPEFEYVTAPLPPVGDGLTLGDTLSGLSMTEGSNIIYAVNNIAAPNIRTYTDTLTTAIPTQTGPADASIVLSPTGTVLMWDIPAGATAVQYRYDTRNDYLSGAAVGNVPAGTAAPNTNVGLPLTGAPIGGVGGLIPGMTYYWSVRVAAPVIGPWSDTISFQTQLAPAAANAPGILGPAAGGTAAGGYNAPLNPTFQWGFVPNSSGYEFQLATDPMMDNVIVDLTGANALTDTAFQLTTITLDYNTTYYWKVRGISGTSETAWSPVTSFTTMAEPAPPAEPGDITVEPPEVTIPDIVIPEIKVPAAQVTVEPTPIVEEPAISTGYLLVIIIIGAILVIAVIVLIVRTRRTV
jgi:hypothetical protein